VAGSGKEEGKEKKRSRLEVGKEEGKEKKEGSTLKK
jgi:hypothetical protein